MIGKIIMVIGILGVMLGSSSDPQPLQRYYRETYVAPAR